MSRFRLIVASRGDGADVFEMLREFPASENGFYNPAFGVTRAQFPVFLDRLDRESRGIGLRPGYVAQTTFWAYAADRPVGIAKVRHRLTDALRETGGHIGYGIRPSERGRGYGRLVLEHALVAARSLGIERVLVTVNADNTASVRVAESNGGVLGRIENGKHYYWFESRSEHRIASHESF